MTAFQLTAITAVLVTASGAATAQTPDQLALELARSIANQTASQQIKSSSTSNPEEAKAAAGAGAAALISKKAGQ